MPPRHGLGLSTTPRFPKYQSSPEYYSSSQERRVALAAAPASAVGYPPADNSQTQSEGEQDYAEQSSHPQVPDPHLPDPGETSDDSQATERDDDVPLVRPGKEQRGKKGLSHAELALAERRDSSANNTPVGQGEETEDDEEAVVEMEIEVDDGEGSDDVDDYATVLRRANVRARTERQNSPWAKCHPIVTETAQILDARRAEPRELGYAKLVGAGKSSVDYLVRKQSIVIGRSAGFADCVIKSDDRVISRKHAKLFYDMERKEWIVLCLSKKNGVVVNGIPIVTDSRPIPVKSRDLIEVGDAAFYFLAATAPVINVNNIDLLEKKLLDVRAQVEKERAESEEERRINEDRYGNLRQGKYLHPSRKYKEKMNQRKALEDMYEESRRHSGPSQSDRYGATKRRSSAVADDDSGHARKKWKQQGKGGRQTRRASSELQDPTGYGQEDYPHMAGEVEEKNGGSSPKTSDRLLGYELSKRRTDRDALDENQRRQQLRDAEDGTKYKEEWTKKEKTDFGRALFAFGVEPVFEHGVLVYYDWTRFRKIAELPKKSDDMLEDYYLRVMTDVNDLLEAEAREKRTKGPRTKHKAGCDCIVCENTRKSRRKKQEERDGPFLDDRADSDGGVEPGVKRSSAKPHDKLVGLVTAQKLRVRLGIHEAARKVTSEAGKAVFRRLKKQPDHSVRDFPTWWKAGVHDRQLMYGTTIHGVGQWSDIWNDSGLPLFRKVKQTYGAHVTWPTNQAAMKRVRDLASLINSEIKREAKRAAKDDRGFPRDGRMRSRNVYDTKDRGFESSRRQGHSGMYEYRDEGRGYPAEQENGEAESTEKSASDNDNIGRRDVSQIETEDEEEVEVEEEIEIEEASAEELPEAPVEQIMYAQKPVVAGDISTDDEEEEEDNIQYETASETGSE